MLFKIRINKTSSQKKRDKNQFFKRGKNKNKKTHEIYSNIKILYLKEAKRKVNVNIIKMFRVDCQ